VATKPRHLKTPTQLWIADNRKRLGLAPGDLARLTGVTEDTARGWESRGKPSQDAMDVLVRTFGVPAPDDMAGPGSDATLPGLAALIVAALDRQTTALEEISAKLERALLVPSPEAAELVADYFRSAPTPSERPRRGRPARPGTQ
jgi:transcriptional regulator with XRE-family HTH domain